MTDVLTRVTREIGFRRDTLARLEGQDAELARPEWERLDLAFTLLSAIARGRPPGRRGAPRRRGGHPRRAPRRGS
jgi:hypothetical protein